MVSWHLALLLVGVCVASCIGTGLTRRYALRKRILDIPTSRSSHNEPVPRGGGLPFVVLFLLAVLLCIWLYPGDLRIWVALFGGGLIVGAVGWIDDRMGLPSFLRLLLYGLGALWAVMWAGGLPRFSLGFAHFSLGVWGYFLGWLGVFCLINFYNFMDGIDGIAAGEGITVSLSAGMLLLMSAGTALAFLCFVLAAGLLGFIRWNWSPARVFMGDVGSNFLGYTFGVLAIASENQGTLPSLVWIVLLAVFVVDGVATMLRRLRRGKLPHIPHRTHAYQGAVLEGFSHRQVVSAVLMINLVLAGLAVLVHHFPLLLLPVLVVSGAVLLAMQYRFSGLRPQFGQEDI